MTRCPECEAEIDHELDEFDVDIGDRLVCIGCAAKLEVVNVVPVELAAESDDATSDPDDTDSAGSPSENWHEDSEHDDPDDPDDEWDV